METGRRGVRERKGWWSLSCGGMLDGRGGGCRTGLSTTTGMCGRRWGVLVLTAQGKRGVSMSRGGVVEAWREGERERGSWGQVWTGLNTTRACACGSGLCQDPGLILSGDELRHVNSLRSWGMSMAGGRGPVVKVQTDGGKPPPLATHPATTTTNTTHTITPMQLPGRCITSIGNRCGCGVLYLRGVDSVSLPLSVDYAL